MSSNFQFIPAIDLIEGKCVRLTQGSYENKKTYFQQPLDAAKQFEDLGLKRLHIVDLDGAKSGKVINLNVLETIASHTSFEIDFGGGVKHETDITSVLNAGAKWVTIGSMAAKQPAVVLEWLKQFGSDKFLIGIDVKGRQVATDGWLNLTTVDIADLITHYFNVGFNHFFCTDISKDGMLQGISTELYKSIIKQFKGIQLIASGGVANINDVSEAQEIGCSGIIVGKAIYEEKISHEQIKKFIRK